MFYKEKRLFSILLIIVGTGMVSSCKPAADPAKEAADRAAAEAEVHRVMTERKRREVAEAVAAAESQAAEEKRAAGLEAQRQEEAAKPRFSPQQLAQAATPKVWAAITVPDINVKAVFNSTWTNGNLNYRVALLGTSQALEMFMRYGRYRINFADQGGNSIFDFELAPRDFVWAPPKTNGGIPTMETRGSVPMDLSLYQAAVQWNLTWYQ